MTVFSVLPVHFAPKESQVQNLCRCVLLCARPICSRGKTDMAMHKFVELLKVLHPNPGGNRLDAQFGFDKQSACFSSPSLANVARDGHTVFSLEP